MKGKQNTNVYRDKYCNFYMKVNIQWNFRML